MAKSPGSRSATRIRADGRKSLLVYLHPELIRELKKAALDDDRTAYDITEEAVSAWLAARKLARERQGE
jgi:hypothetical protein